MFVVIVIGLKLMHHSNPPVVPAAPVAQQPALTAVPASFPTPVQSTATSSALSDTQDRLSALHDQLSSVVAANAQLTQSMSALTTQVATLAAAVQDTSQKLDTMTMKPGVMNKLRYQPAPIIYVIKALVPGRAWLVGSNGVSVNVAVGNYLSGYYGSIQSINASTGQVMTTRGKAITYGSNDS